MKKSILAIVLMAVASMTVSAASISWQTDPLYFDTVVLKNTGATAISGYLLYLSAGDPAPSYVVDASFSETSVGTLAMQLDGTPKSGKFKGDFDFVYPAYTEGDTFMALVSYVNAADGLTYWNLSANKYVASGLSDNGASLTASDFEFSSTVNAPGTLLTAGGGWVAVPEPATGALALAGLALLFRRKRA